MEAPWGFLGYPGSRGSVGVSPVRGSDEMEKHVNLVVSSFLDASILGPPFSVIRKSFRLPGNVISIRHVGVDSTSQDPRTCESDTSV